MKSKLTKFLMPLLVIAVLVALFAGGLYLAANAEALDEGAVMTSEMLVVDVTGGPLISGEILAVETGERLLSIYEVSTSIGSEATPAIISDSGAYLSTATNEAIQSQSNNPAAWSNISMAVMFLSVVSLTYFLLIKRIKINDRKHRVHPFTANWRDTIRHPLKFPASA